MPEIHEKSKALYKRGKELIPGASQTNSKKVQFLLRSEDKPVYIDHGRNAHLFDVDGNEYIDYVMSLGPITLGYNHPAVNEAIRKQLDKGTLFSLAHESEVELAELLSEVIPCAEMCRFFKSGAEGTSASVRLARSITGKDIILSSGYHGWHDWDSLDKGVPQAVKDMLIEFPYNDIAEMEKCAEKHKENFAAIIVNPYEMDPNMYEYLSRARQLATENNALLVFDEIVTGFRLSIGGAQQYFDVIPDLAVFAKGMANGMPVAALTGKKEYMKVMEERWITTTYGGEVLSIAASIATIRELKKPGMFEHTYNLGSKLKEGLIKLSKDKGLPFTAKGLPPMSYFVMEGKNQEHTDRLYNTFHIETFNRGILFKYPFFNFICATHTEEDINKSLNAADEALNEVKKIL